MIIMSLWRPWNHRGTNSNLTLPTRTPTTSVLATIEDKMKSFKAFYGIRDCSIPLVRITPEEIKRYRRHSSLIPPLPLPPPVPRPPVSASWGKQIHFQKPRGRGRPRKMDNGQCKVDSLSESLMRLKIVKVTKGRPDQRTNQQEKKIGVKRQRLNAAAASIASNVVQTGYFDSLLISKAKSTSRLKKRARIMTPKCHDWATNSNFYSYSSPFSYRSPFRGVGSYTPRAFRGKHFIKIPKIDKKRRPKYQAQDFAPMIHHCVSTEIPTNSVSEALCRKERKKQSSLHGKIRAPVTPTAVVTETPTSSSSGSLVEPVIVKRKKKRKNSDGGDPPPARRDGGTSSEDGHGWVSALMSTNLATEVVKEAVCENFIPDISMIQDFTEDLADFIENNVDCSLLRTRSSPENPPIVSSSTSDPLNGFYMSTPENIDDEPELTEEVRPLQNTARAIHQFEFYEELYKNDVLLINAEDEDLPLPI